MGWARRAPRGWAKAIGFLVAILVSILAVAPAAIANVVGRVVQVLDGDTIVLAAPTGEELRVRLRDVDAPEDGQPGSQQARYVLRTLVQGRDVRIVEYGQDRNGRILADVFANDVLINEQLVRLGAAWAYEDRLSTPDYLVWQSEAEANAVGIWAEATSRPIAPWSWRAGQRAVPRPQAAIAAVPAPLVAQPLPSTRVAPAPRITRSGGSELSERRRSSARSQTRTQRQFSSARSQARSGRCGGKRTCGEMASCGEAQFYLRTCGVSRLDGDGDGVPCESIC